MTCDSDLVELTTASTLFEAEWIVGALESFEIVAVTFGDALADDFAMSQKLMGLSGGVRVMVRQDGLEAARQALVEIKKNRPTEAELEAAVAEAANDPEAESESDKADATDGDDGPQRLD